MIEIGQLPNARAAQAFIDYLKGLDIECHPVVIETGVSLVVEQPSQAQQAKYEFEQFRQNPYQKKYLQASWDNGTTQTKLDYGSSSLGLIQQFITGAGPLTLITFFVCVLVYAGMNLGFANGIFSQLSFFGAVPQSDISQIWRVFTPSLMHFSLMHIAFNLLWWWYLGGKIETKLGSKPLIILLVVAGSLPSIVQYMMTGPNFGGLSGVVYAVVGYTWIMGQRQPQSGIGIPNSYMGFMLVWLVLGFTDLLGMPIANGAHIGGLLIGLAQGAFDSRKSAAK
ncbi:MULTISPECIES: rhomboid family intramembrane serine protease GlpG [unclassified Shewanella]|uniref:rhomboid family intramembrane serine protease GlpG n=1 Tax=unclassified Shewanella TaxID=196818 RepID=UPI000C8621C4|nr:MULTISPECIES: rhomboid family intramembrane serine protease GlpG [unclassified Shewanella]MDO6639510.1 rhomboid family intramembrane serine protease GlpG [Shewanella sp. 5_MG-2023]MDO6677978.1 rhomboid family intramembrane serine protease GlpG [Shewanella sp. 4_MG-2023]MDO6775176.1 rhomboid family intramembrane serine protease GlpG [Shewanella sp. 3_MG-2023]PMG52463.1 rhomboid family intramembrane serine protease GlpG [Shewanella sp. 10N.286.52.B9]PMH89088.1 rhomboid family intramembrane se